jgi:protoporphyrin/coproporphyrin ferrochelatase
VCSDVSVHSEQRIGVLLINLGTPDSPSVADVRKYLREFLNDPRVIDISPFGRWFLVNLVVLPFRPKRSAHAYQKVWMKEGSPLLVYSVQLTEKVQEKLGDRFVVRLAMRYQSPSLESTFEELLAADVEKIIIVPLFPQYSSAATGSALDKVFDIAAHKWNVPVLETVGPFYEDEGFIRAFAEIARPVIDDLQADYVLFSYHGLPERQVKKSDPTGKHCLADASCCDAIGPANRYCYRAHCFATTRALVARLGLDAARHGVSFQSRLGRTPWIKPYTDEVIHELRNKGVKRLAILSPAFVADCLETLEEIAIGLKERWLELGGEQLVLVPSLNAHPTWVDAVVEMIERRV